MNIYSYFQKIDEECKSVSMNHIDLYNWVIFKTKEASLSKMDAFDIINWARILLEEDEVSNMDFKKEAMCRIQEKKKHLILRELSDFGVYLFVYITCLNVLYENIVGVLFVGSGFHFTLDITIGFLIQIIGVYLSFKLLIYFFATNPNRASIRFWLELACLFGLYMFSNYLKTVYTVVLFKMPVLLWVLMSVLLLIVSIRFVKHENIL